MLLGLPAAIADRTAVSATVRPPVLHALPTGSAVQRYPLHHHAAMVVRGPLHCWSLCSERDAGKGERGEDEMLNSNWYGSCVQKGTKGD